MIIRNYRGFKNGCQNSFTREDKAKDNLQVQGQSQVLGLQGQGPTQLASRILLEDYIFAYY